MSDRDLANHTFKIRLQAEADVEVERLKSSLQVTTLEHQVRFSKLHEKRAEVIAEVYEKLADVNARGKVFLYTMWNSSNPPEL